MTAGKPSFLDRAVVFFEQLTHAIVRQRRDDVIITAGHVTIVDQRVHDGFFRRLDDTGEKRIN